MRWKNAILKFFDVPGAFLQAEVPKNKSIILNIRNECVDILCKVNPEYKKHVRTYRKHSKCRQEHYKTNIRNMYEHFGNNIGMSRHNIGHYGKTIRTYTNMSNTYTTT